MQETLEAIEGRDGTARSAVIVIYPFGPQDLAAKAAEGESCGLGAGRVVDGRVSFPMRHFADTLPGPSACHPNHRTRRKSHGGRAAQVPRFELPTVSDGVDMAASRYRVTCPAGFDECHTEEPSIWAQSDRHINRVVVCCGTGGVGKTATAAALALRAAESSQPHCGRFDGDPAKRWHKH